MAVLPGIHGRKLLETTSNKIHYANFFKDIYRQNFGIEIFVCHFPMKKKKDREIGKFHVKFATCSA